MTYDPIDPSAVTSGGTISKTAFGDKVVGNFADHETRIGTNESAISNLSGNLNTILSVGGRRWHSGTATLIGTSQAAGIPVIHPFDSVEGTESGYTYITSGANTGGFQVANTGVYALFGNTCGIVGVDTGYYVQSFIAKVSSGAPAGFRYGYDAVGIGTASQRVFMRPGAMNVSLNANDIVAVFVCFDVSSGSGKTYTPSVPSAPAGLSISSIHPSNFSIKRVG